MKKVIALALTLIFSTNFVLLAVAPIALAATSIGTDINAQLDPIKTDAYGVTSQSTPAKTVALIIKVALGFLGIIFLTLMVYAGFLWMTAAGNEDRIEKSKKIMTAAIIGTAIIMMAYLITNFVIRRLITVTGADY